MGNTVIKPAPVCWFIENSKVFTIERISSNLNIPCFFLEYFNTEMLWNGTVPRKQPCLQISSNLSIEVDFYLLSWIFFFFFLSNQPFITCIWAFQTQILIAPPTSCPYLHLLGHYLSWLVCYLKEVDYLLYHPENNIVRR